MYQSMVVESDANLLIFSVVFLLLYLTRSIKLCKASEFLPYVACQLRKLGFIVLLRKVAFGSSLIDRRKGSHRNAQIFMVSNNLYYYYTDSEGVALFDSLFSASLISNIL